MGGITVNNTEKLQAIRQRCVERADKLLALPATQLTRTEQLLLATIKSTIAAIDGLKTQYERPMGCASQTMAETAISAILAAWEGLCMNDRPTPETDAAKRHKSNPCLPDEVVPAFFSARLERERDEAREQLAEWANRKAVLRQNAELRAENALLTIGPAEAGWWSPATVKAYEKKSEELRAENERLTKENTLLRNDADKEWGASATERARLSAENERLRKAGNKLAHYVAEARKGDSPIIHAWIVEAVDSALQAWQALAATNPSSNSTKPDGD